MEEGTSQGGKLFGENSGRGRLAVLRQERGNELAKGLPLSVPVDDLENYIPADRKENFDFGLACIHQENVCLFAYLLNQAEVPGYREVIGVLGSLRERDLCLKRAGFGEQGEKLPRWPEMRGGLEKVMKDLDERYDCLFGGGSNVEAVFGLQIAVLERLEEEYPDDLSLKFQLKGRKGQLSRYRLLPERQREEGLVVYRAKGLEEAKAAAAELGFQEVEWSDLPKEGVEKVRQGQSGQVKLKEKGIKTESLKPCLAVCARCAKEGEVFLRHHDYEVNIERVLREIGAFARGKERVEVLLFGGEAVDLELRALEEREGFLRSVRSLGLPVKAIFKDYGGGGWGIAFTRDGVFCELS